ncbi:hypothetical protein LCGC14_0754720 [marine sediment metagenome]|uniref:Uncharacterized protein n=1 Tax=marine sediment metagenome TaxID=412755 RepID=A0A0F9QMV6_9ZZZZ
MIEQGDYGWETWENEEQATASLAKHTNEGNPLRGGKPSNTLCGDALAGHFGLSALLPPSAVAATTTGLARLSRTSDLFAGEPRLLAVNLSLVHAEIAGSAVNVFARLVWTTGEGRHTAEVDVPASGTTLTVAAADGLEVFLIRQPSANLQEVRGVLSVARASSAAGSPQRTVVTPVLPLVVDEVIPNWAKSVRTLPDTLGALAAPAGRLQFFAFRGGAVLVDVIAPADGASVPVPLGARFFRVLGGAGAVVRAVFGLSLP